VIRDLDFFQRLSDDLPHRVDDTTAEIARLKAEAQRVLATSRNLQMRFAEDQPESVVLHIRELNAEYKAIQAKLAEAEKSALTRKAKPPAAVAELQTQFTSNDPAIQLQARMQMATVFRSVLKTAYCHPDRSVRFERIVVDGAKGHLEVAGTGATFDDIAIAYGYDGKMKCGAWLAIHCSGEWKELKSVNAPFERLPDLQPISLGFFIPRNQ
jgi:hypothetical protein